MPEEQVSLREYVDTRLSDHLHNLEMNRASLEKRLDQMNNLREQLRQQEQAFLPRGEHDLLAERVGKAESKLSNIEGRLWILGIGIPLLVTALSLIIDKFFR